MQYEVCTSLNWLAEHAIVVHFSENKRAFLINVNKRTDNKWAFPPSRKIIQQIFTSVAKITYNYVWMTTSSSCSNYDPEKQHSLDDVCMKGGGGGLACWWDHKKWMYRTFPTAHHCLFPLETNKKHNCKCIVLTVTMAMKVA